MNVFLMYQSRNLDLQEELPHNTPDLVSDLTLERLFQQMSLGDGFLLEVACHTVLIGLHRPEDILYRQRILSDCFKQPSTIRDIYRLAVEAIERERRVWGVLGKYPEALLRRSVEVLEVFVPILMRLKGIADSHGQDFVSDGFTRFFAMISRELDEDYIADVKAHLERLSFPEGMRISARLGKGNHGDNYVLRSPLVRAGWRERLHRWLERLSPFAKQGKLVYQISERDENGLRALAEIRERGISEVAATLTQSMDHILEFFKMLRAELGFYIGCLNLRDRLLEKGEPICFPKPAPPGRLMFSAYGLYDVCLSLSVPGRVVGNDVDAGDCRLIMMTGANRGGKSTLLRAIGLSQMMMQCGMFVPAVRFEANPCSGVFTHFKREEDVHMRSGKLDEELSRMSVIVDQMARGSLILLNESFASTNEREGAEIAQQIVKALVESEIKVCYVTHMFALAEALYRTRVGDALSLRAERLAGGERTFKLIQAEPLPTSYGQDLYKRIFRDRPLVAEALRLD